MTALFVARPLFPSESAANYGDGLPIVMLWIALAAVWLLGAIGRPTFQVRFGWTDAAVLLLLGWYAVSSLWAIQHGTARPAINMLWEWFGLGLCFFMARQLVLTSQESRAVAGMMIAVAVALSTYGLYQRLYELPSTHAEYLANPDKAMRDAGLWFPSDSPERALFEARLENREPLATFALTNSLAAFLAPWLVLLAAAAIASRTATRRVWPFVACGLPIALCLAFTKSRSGYIAAVVGLLLTWAFCGRRRLRIGWKTVSAMSTALLFIILLCVAGLDHGLLQKAVKSFGYRVQYWQSSLQLIAEHPIVGCGPGNFQNAYPHYKLPEASEEIADPHNFLLDIWANAGTPAMVAFLAALGCFGWTTVRGRRDVVSDQSSVDSKSEIINHPSENPVRNLSPIFFGGAIGFFLSIPIGLLSAAPPGIAVVLLGGPLAVVAIWLLRGWIRNGRLPASAPAIGVVVLLIDLLAAGGIGLPSVAGTLWLLLALGLQGDPAKVLRPFAAWVLLGVVIFLAIACYQTAYNPVLTCQGHMRLAQRQATQAVQQLEAAAAADPLAVEPWRQLASIAFDQWQQHPEAEVFKQFERANAKVLELSPNAAPNWLNSGEWYFRAFSQTDRNGRSIMPRAIHDALSAYQKAVELYPNSASYRAKLAEAYGASGDEPQFRQEAEAALRLDKATPHSDKKLPPEVRKRLRQRLGENSQ